LKEVIRQERQANAKVQAEFDRTTKAREDSLRALFAAETVTREVLNDIETALLERDENKYWLMDWFKRNMNL
jgi:hypothetical protein